MNWFILYLTYIGAVSLTTRLLKRALRKNASSPEISKSNFTGGERAVDASTDASLALDDGGDGSEYKGGGGGGGCGYDP